MMLVMMPAPARWSTTSKSRSSSRPFPLRPSRQRKPSRRISSVRSASLLGKQETAITNPIAAAYIKRVNKALAEKGASEETIKQFQGGAGAAMKKLVANYDNYDFLMGSSMDPKGMYILIDFREDGVTPYATLWKHGLVGQKV